LHFVLFVWQERHRICKFKKSEKKTNVRREMQMPTRKLLSVTLGKASLIPTPSIVLASWDVCEVNDLAAARKAYRNHPYPVGLVLLNNPNDSELLELDELLETHQSTQWVGVFPAESVRIPINRKLIIQHLFDFHTWPIDPFRLNHTLGHAYGYAELSGPIDNVTSNTGDMALVGQSASIQQLRRQIAKVASAGAPVLIWGESGSGKELTARAIHNHSLRVGGPFVALNCGAIPASLIQSELFGYERGAFTGAANMKRGLIESAAGGTLFLDEIGDLPLELQANLLRFLQERTISRLGSLQSIEVDVRVIAASHTRLDHAVKSQCASIVSACITRTKGRCRIAGQALLQGAPARQELPVNGVQQQRHSGDQGP
jgi:DNA-binding NtrC family response regulator